MRVIPTLMDYLRPNEYPGRGIAVGITEDGMKGVFVYFIMGRSENSRNRVFTLKGDDLVTEPFDPSKVEDPSLIIYSAVKILGNVHVITNGDQTDTIYDGLLRGVSFEESLKTRTFEPDGPNYTPRISCVFKAERKPEYAFSILKSDKGDSSSVLRQTFYYETPLPGMGRFIHTYQGDGSPLPSFAGEPEDFVLHYPGLDEFTAEVWDALNTNNRISLFVREVDLRNGAMETKLVNKHDKGE